ncbi:hypothetical protein MAPG_10747 [Magnaporthiopsis poae ATCC 64411]|uniref:Uncharacterized protein n=1 Tax=Magnaporthiopsis poae (strain ATCC 64411 / 73-15) TaxID=644358 RepID=A0A0C4EDE9_MAGP6|nr:hypothetical protein MAPG_10747 [Magnaporthiopsis poae ATCC 64411]
MATSDRLGFAARSAGSLAKPKTHSSLRFTAAFVPPQPSFHHSLLNLTLQESEKSGLFSPCVTHIFLNLAPRKAKSFSNPHPDAFNTHILLSSARTSTAQTFDAGEAQLQTKVVDGVLLADRAFLEGWVRARPQDTGPRWRLAGVEL